MNIVFAPRPRAPPKLQKKAKTCTKFKKHNEINNLRAIFLFAWRCVYCLALSRGDTGVCQTTRTSSQERVARPVLLCVAKARVT